MAMTTRRSATPTTTAALPCAIYSRVSTDEQVQAYGLTSQQHELRALAARKGYRVVEELADEGISGTILDRPALATLRDGVRAGRYRVVLVHAPDRLSRKLAHQLVLLDEFAQAGASVEFLTTPAEDTAEGRMLLNMSGVIAEFEREKIKARTIAGKRQKARSGLVVSPGNPPYGYRPAPTPPGQTPGRLVVYEPEAQVVRRIYRAALDEHRTLHSIVAELRRDGVRSRRGPWGKTQVRRILSASTYAGAWTFDDGTGGRIPVAVDAIVSRDEQAAAHAQLVRNRERMVGRPGRAPFLLRGLLVCATCGRTVRIGALKSRRRYSHQDQRPDAPCLTWFSFQADAAEAAVRDALTVALRDPAVLRAGVERWQTTRGATDIELRSRVAHLEKQVAKLRRDERRLIDLVVGDGEQQAVVEGKLRELARQRGTLTEQLRAAEAKVAQHAAGTVSAEAVERIGARARRGLDRLDAAGWRALVEQLVDEIRVLPDRSLEIRGILVAVAAPKWDRPSWRPGAGSASPAGTAGT